MLTPSLKSADRVTLPQGFKKGQVFTPPFLAAWCAGLLRERLGSDWRGRIWDPACGDGQLLMAAANDMPNAALLGADIDAGAIQAAHTNLDANLRVGDALAGDAPGNVGAIISNPPWGADILHTKAQLRSMGYTLAHGQFDSWSLFVERCLNTLEQGGVAVFILPDAIFAPEHAVMREFIAKGNTLELIARLGEGVFKGVARGTAVVLIRKSKPAADHKVEVLRLPKTQRAAILSGALDLNTQRRDLGHSIAQSRFLTDPKCRWDIDVRPADHRVLAQMDGLAGDWVSVFNVGRGVELSKRGIIKRCPSCGYAVPLPRAPKRITCVGCGEITASPGMKTDQIVGTDSGDMPFVVGEDIGRYTLTCTRHIKLGVPGINYKDQRVYSQERLLIRKTGVGLKAVVTRKHAASNQVVFHYVPKSEDCGFMLYYVLGVLSSRIMFAYHLKKSGESEWRSHPYVTPKALRTLPIPLPQAGTQVWRQAQAIAKMAQKHSKGEGTSKPLDLKIEGAVAGLFNLTQTDMAWVKDVITGAQNLEPMRVLGDFDPQSVPIHRVS